VSIIGAMDLETFDMKPLKKIAAKHSATVVLSIIKII
jgi:hypothetical protein